nr:immunoglobulin light chain junction region [Macaca mulatta]
DFYCVIWHNNAWVF